MMAGTSGSNGYLANNTWMRKAKSRGYVVRISVWNDGLGQNEILEVYEGMIFPIGDQRFQVIEAQAQQITQHSSRQQQWLHCDRGMVHW